MGRGTLKKPTKGEIEGLLKGTLEWMIVQYIQIWGRKEFTKLITNVLNTYNNTKSELRRTGTQQEIR